MAHHVPVFLHLLFGQGGILQEHVAQAGRGLVIRGLAAADDGHAVLIALAGAHPHAEAGKVCGDRGHGMGGAFLRGIAPGLVPGGEYAQIAGGQHLFIAHVQEAVLAVEQGRIEDDLHVVLRPVVQAQALAGIEDGIVGLVVDVMAADPEAALAGEFGRVAADCVGIDPAVSAHDRAQGQHIGLGLAEGRIDHAEGVKEHVDALVVILITAGHEEDAGILGQPAAQQTAGGLQQPLPGSRGQAPVPAVVGDDAQVQTVEGQHIGGTPQKDARLVGRDAADGGEAVGFACRGRLHGAFGRDIVGPGLMLGVDLVHLLVDVEAGTGHGAPQHGGVRGEDRAHIGGVGLEIEQAAAAHPFVEVGQGRAVGRDVQRLAGGLDHFAAGRTEHDRFHIVPAAGDGVHAVAVPEREQQLALVVTVTVPDQDDFGAAGDVPAAEAAAQVAPVGLLAQLLPAGLVGLFKVGVVAQVGPQKKIIFSKGSQGFQDLAADDGIDAADLVADLPADFEEGRV